MPQHIEDENHEQVMISAFGTEYIHLRATRLSIQSNGTDIIILFETPTNPYRVFVRQEAIEPSDPLVALKDKLL